MESVILAGSAHPRLASDLARALGIEAAAANVERFPDGELQVRVTTPLADRRVIVVQPLGPPVNEHLMELLFLLDACHRAGASALTVVAPYVGYARQDRRGPGEPVGIRVVGEALAAMRPDRVIVVDPHTQALEAVFGMPVDYVNGAPALADAMARHLDGPAVVIAPDLGAVKLAEHYSALLDLPTAVVRKRRITGLEVEASELIGNVAGRIPIIVDDMLSTGGTVLVATNLMLQLDCVPRIAVLATHGLFVGPAVAQLRDLSIERIVVTDTLPRAPGTKPLPLEVVSIAPALAETIRSRAAG